MQSEPAAQRRRSKSYDLRAVHHHLLDQEVLDGLHEELRHAASTLFGLRAKVIL
jgi:hypothetical protein